MTETPEQARRYAELERSLEPQRQRSIARGPIGFVGVMIGLALAVGVVAAIDLQRLQTPRGAALAWTSATVFGDCTAYERLSVPAEGENDDRSAEEVCRDLREQTAPAREASARYSLQVLSVEQQGDEATVRVQVGRPDGERTVEREVDLRLRRDGADWIVQRTAEVCRVVRCP